MYENQTIQFWVQWTMQFTVKMSAMVLQREGLPSHTKAAELADKNHYTYTYTT